MKKTAIYIRVSTDKQVQEGDSIPAQRNALVKYINDHNDMILTAEYVDDGVSGTRDDRTEFQKMLQDVKNGSIDVILVTKLDRLHRSLKNFLSMQEILDKNNCNWTAIWEPIYDSSTPQGRMIINTMVNLAQFEAEQTGQRIRQVQQFKVEKGEVISGTTPPGYKIENKHLVPDEHAADVASIFRYYSKVGKIDKAIYYAKDMDFVPHTDSSFKNMLKNTKYIGVFRGNNNYCPAIVNRDLFEDVQRKLKMNICQGQRYAYIFSGLLVCEECGCKMAGASRIRHRNADDLKVRLYRCQKRYNRVLDKCSNTKHLWEHKLEEYLLENIKTCISEYIVSCKEKQKPVSDSKQKIAKVNRKLTRLKELYVNDLISLDEYKSDKEQYEKELATLLEEQKAVKEPINLDNLEKYLDMDIKGLYAPLTNEEKRYFWRSIIKEIHFDGQRNIRVIFL